MPVRLVSSTQVSISPIHRVRELAAEATLAEIIQYYNFKRDMKVELNFWKIVQGLLSRGIFRVYEERRGGWVLSISDIFAD